MKGSIPHKTVLPLPQCWVCGSSDPEMFKAISVSVFQILIKMGFTPREAIKRIKHGLKIMAGDSYILVCPTCREAGKGN